LTNVDGFTIFGKNKEIDMKTERKKVFETNSSSCHSITFDDSKANDMNGLKLYVNGSGEYGWQEETLYNSDEKLDYAVVAFFDQMSKYLPTDTQVGEVKEKLNKLKSDLETKIGEAIDKVTECFERHGVILVWDEKLREVEVSEKWLWVHGKCSGYIDHQSAPREGGDSAVLAEWFKNDPEKLYNFVFNDSTIRLDNDNH
jgi:hypothetical protein